MEIKAIKHFPLAYVRQKSALSWRAVIVRGVMKNHLHHTWIDETGLRTHTSPVSNVPGGSASTGEA